MTNDKALTITDEEIKNEGHRIRTLLPGGSRLTDNQANSLGFYGKAADANAMRGEIYGFSEGRGGFKLIDGYKLLIRWAKEQSEYDEHYFYLTDEEKETQRIPSTSLAYRCRILRQDKRDGIKAYMDLGATFNEAIEEVSTSAVGVVSAKKMKGDPPEGWSWAQVAQKRALKNALNWAYAMPSLQQLAKKFLDVDGTQTEPEDWEGVRIYKTSGEQRQAAKVNAWGRVAKDKREAMTPEELRAESQANIDLMRGTIEDEERPLGEEPDRVEIKIKDSVIDEPPAEVEAKHFAKIMPGVGWGEASRQLVEACPAYRLENGKPNMSEILAAAWAEGFKEITSENLGDVLTRLSDAAFMPSETEVPSSEELIPFGDEKGDYYEEVG